MELHVIDSEFTVCKITDHTQVDISSPYYFLGKTDEELSLVCPTDRVPATAVQREDGWRAFRIQGVLDFSLIGILSPIANILAENRIGIFAVSTFNTDYILTKSEDFDRALALLAQNGYRITR